MTERFIEPDAKIEAMSDEELALVAGGAATTYISQPYMGKGGNMVVTALTVSGNYTYDPSTKTVNMGALTGSGTSSQMTFAASKLGAYTDRLTQRGNTIINLDIGGPLL